MAQILGALIACALVYNQWKSLIVEAEAALMAEGAAVFDATQFTANGPPGIFAFYLLPGQTLARVFLNEFVNVSNILGVTIFLTHSVLCSFEPSVHSLDLLSGRHWIQQAI